MNLTVRQERALEQLKRIPVPPAPAISKASLIQVPLWVRWAPVGGVLLTMALIGLAFVRLPLAEGGSHIVISEGLQTIHFPIGNTTLILQSPADLQIRRMARRLLSGRLEAELVLGKGELFLQADPKAPKLILIRTPFLQARITGTQLLIGHRPEEGSRLVVIHGQVEARLLGGVWQPVRTGQELTVTPEGSVLLRPIQGAVDLSGIPLAPAAADASLRDREAAEAISTPPDPLRRLIWHEQE